MIENIKTSDEVFYSGTIYSSLFGKNIKVMIKKNTDMNYAEICAEHFSSLNDSMIDKICERISAYHKFMLEEWDSEFVSEINKKVPCDVSGRDILKYVENPQLYISKPEGSGTGYIIEGLCEWEPEHGIDIVILNDKVIYTGSPEEITPWSDDEECFCEY